MANAKANYSKNASDVGTDKRLVKVAFEEKEALSETETAYSGMINNSQKFYDKQIQASKDYEDKQTEIQNQQTDLAIKEINQQKAQAKKDYTKEQSGAYTDWQKQSNPYGVGAEEIASMGLSNSGYSESSQVAMYNQYQMRVTAARESYTLAVQNYDNMIAKARLENNAALAKIAAEAFQQQLSLSLEGFKYENELVLAKQKEKREIKNDYFTRWQSVINQINTEKAQKEAARHNKEVEAAQAAQLAEEKRQFDILHSSSGGGSGGGSGSGGKVKESSSGGSSSGIVIKSSKDGIKYSAPKTTNTSSSSTKSSKSSTPTPDMNSVLALGFGPISAEELNSLIEKGIVQEYVDGDKLKYKKVIGE